MSDNRDDKSDKALLSEILSKLSKAEVLNGSFDRLAKDISEMKSDVNDINMTFIKINLEMDNIKKNGDAREKTLTKIYDAIYDPNDGLFSSIKDNENDFQTSKSKLNELNAKLDNTKKDLMREIDATEDKIESTLSDTKLELNRRLDDTNGKIKIITEPLIATNEAIVAIGGDSQLSNIRNVTDTHKNISKLWWALILAVVSGFGKFIWDVIQDVNR